jgi:hypothetical protein
VHTNIVIHWIETDAASTSLHLMKMSLVICDGKHFAFLCRPVLETLKFKEKIDIALCHSTPFSSLILAAISQACPVVVAPLRFM